MKTEEAIRTIKAAQSEVEWEYPMEYAAAFDMAISALQKQDLQLTCNQLATDTISRQALCEYALNQKDKSVTPNDIMRFPSVQPDGWLEQNKDKILQAGMEGREIDFRIGGRLFAIREKAQ